MSGWQRLAPFPEVDPSPSRPDLNLVGAFACHQGSLQLRFRLQGDLHRLTMPERSGAPTRRDGLWEHTCFEAFWGQRGDERYWELNASPSGDWNLYRLDRYREGLRPESLAQPPHCQWTLGEAPGGGQQLELELWCDLPLQLQAAGLEVALTAVVEQGDGTLSYWGLVHPGPEPDFHRRDSFVLRP